MDCSNEIQMQQRMRSRLVLFPMPLQGHINPMLQLANILHSKGFNITVIHTKFNYPNPSKYPNFTFLPIFDGISESEISTKDVISLLSILNIKCVIPFRDCLAKLVSGSSDEPIGCLVTDSLWHFSQEVADGLKIRRIVLRTSSVTSFLVFEAFPILRQKGYLPKQESRLDSLVPELPPLRIKDIPTVDITSHQEDLYQLIESMVKATKASSGLVLNTFKELEEPALATLGKDFSVPIFPIGPFHRYFPASSSSLLAHDKTSISWLDKQAPKSVIYVSFGSIASMVETEFLEMAWGLANSMQPFLWVVRPGLVRGSEWLEPLPNGFIEALNGRGHIVQWAPQQEVLAHSAIGGFLSHNGWNSTLESICEGVPMICGPCLGDQFVNARYISNIWRIGVELENGLERGEIEKVIRRVMVEKEGEEMRERILGLKEKVNISLQEGGSSYQALNSLTTYILSS